MTLEVVYPEVDKINIESTVIQVEAKMFDSVKPLKNDLLDIMAHVTPSSRSSRSGDHRRSRIGVKVGWFQGDILTLGIIETVQNHHLVTKETTEIMKIKEADMKVQGELLIELSQHRSLAVWISRIISAVVLIFLLSLGTRQQHPRRRTSRDRSESIVEPTTSRIHSQDDIGFKAATYKRGLSILEAQVVKFKESEVLFSEEIALLKRSVGHKEYLMGLLKTELEKVKEEKEGFEFKIAKFEKSSKDLDALLASHPKRFFEKRLF
ncbi:hypothetical protein Tco_0412779 [Tanacetum coccineum]